jgi:hypothetical protein
MKDWLYSAQIYRYTQDERGVAERAFTEILRFGFSVALNPARR